ncbi:putative spermidine/putrescine transport system permease protein [Arboricoccus pini]|uniref:Putative spermidine/putrescine transport system permease protein n=1 Tax=Arboricoccus pini TaxID=1963835 RepID=A0A212RJN7_9PROT|nr:ABC transporter permease [Arboricoccus pini]SNB72635.1 putative spermidine/putrescine transport system permease protein [Arboricoccus pini]
MISLKSPRNSAQSNVSPPVKLLGSALIALTVFMLLAPLVAVIPLSFSSEKWFTYPMPGFSLRWYESLFASDQWRGAIANSFIVGTAVTIIATPLGTMAALAISRPETKGRNLLLLLFLSPMVVPVVVTALGFYLFFARFGLANSYTGLIIAHTVIAAPFVVITMLAAFSRFDFRLMRAAASLGASKMTAFRIVMMPLILPSLMASAILAFITSFDEVVIAIFIAGPDQRTIPRQMFTGMREEISPTIIAASVVVIAVVFALMATAELLRRRAAAGLKG